MACVSAITCPIHVLISEAASIYTSSISPTSSVPRLLPRLTPDPCPLTWHLQHLHPVQQSRGDGGGGVCRGNEQNLGEVEGYVEVVVGEAVVLFWIQNLDAWTQGL